MCIGGREGGGAPWTKSSSGYGKAGKNDPSGILTHCAPLFREHLIEIPVHTDPHGTQKTDQSLRVYGFYES